MTALASPGTPRFGDPRRPSHHACSNCGLCLLPCPVWNETRDPFLTAAGRARALQGGAAPEELVASVEACVMCGACEPVCPERIDTVGLTLGLRAHLAARGRLPLAAAVAGRGTIRGQPGTAAAGDSRSERVLFPGRALATDPALLARAVRHLGGPARTAVAPVDGERTVLEIEAGGEPDISMFVEIWRGRGEVVVFDGLLARAFRPRLGSKRVVGLGEALLRVEAVRRDLGPGDLLVVEPRAFNGDHERLVGFYDRLRRERGIELGLDLQRAAMATGTSSAQARLGRPTIDAREAARWLVEGRKARRIVVESLDDRPALAAVAAVPVVHLAELGR